MSVSQLRQKMYGVLGLVHLSLLPADGISEPISQLCSEAVLGLLQTRRAIPARYHRWLVCVLPLQVIPTRNSAPHIGQSLIN